MRQLRQQISPPSSWEDFEALCCALFQEEWRNPQAQLHGRRGQAQQGVDVFGQSDDGKWYGVQCKGKEVNYGAQLTTSEIDAELAKADTFVPKLDYWIIATTAPVDAKLQAHARSLTQARVARGLCPVSVYGWGNIEDLLEKYPEVKRHYFPQLFAQHGNHVHLGFAPSAIAHYFDPHHLLPRLHAQLRAYSQSALLPKASVQGMGGVGKTQLALHYIQHYQAEYDGVWWFSAESEAGLESACITFCEKQHIPRASNEAAASAMRAWLLDATNYRQPWLLVYDNAEDSALLQKFLPQIGSHHVLLTSRNPHWQGFQGLALDVWDTPAACEFLQQRLPNTLWDTPKLAEDLRALSAALGGLPLALEQACAYIETRNVSVADYCALLSKHQEQLLAGTYSSECPNSVRATLALAFVHLSPAAQAVLHVCSWLAAEPVPEYLFVERRKHLPPALQGIVEDNFAWSECVAQLLKYGLCKREKLRLLDHAGNGEELALCLQFHRLTLAAARQGADGGSSLLLLSLPWDSDQPKNWPRYQLLRPHVEHVRLHYQEEWQQEKRLGWLLNQMAVYLQFGVALYQDALRYFRQALAIAENASGAEHPTTGTYLNNLAELYQATGDYRSALPLCQRALAIAELALGAEHSDTGICLNNLATLYQATGDYASALPLCQRALAIAEKVLGAEHPTTGAYLNNLASLYKATGDYASALPLYQRALAITEQALGAEHPSTGIRLNNLATLYMATGDYASALPLYQRALTIAEKALGAAHPDTGRGLNNLALLYKATGDYRAALPLYQRALGILQQALSAAHPYTKRAAANLASLQTKLKQG